MIYLAKFNFLIEIMFNIYRRKSSFRKSFPIVFNPSLLDIDYDF